MFKGKILSVYYPNQFLNIYSAKHLNHFINILSLDNSSKQELHKQEVLLNFKNNDAVMKEWTVYEFSKFLYTQYGAPNDETKAENISNALKEKLTKDFPPIEKIKFKYVDLETKKVERKNQKNQSSTRKIDYAQRTKRFKRIGDRGEQIVLRAEKKRLEKNNRKDLSKLIDHIAKRDDSAGYDIISYETNGEKRYIEVKTTLKQIGNNNIFLSANELEVSKRIKNYYFYIVYEADQNIPKIWRVKGDKLMNNDDIEMVPTQYRINIHTKEI